MYRIYVRQFTTVVILGQDYLIKLHWMIMKGGMKKIPILLTL